MARTLEIYVPCDVVTINVKVGPGDALSPLEELFLRAVAAGVTGFDDLAAMFGLSRRKRLVLDLVFELWQARYLTVDIDRAEVRLTSEVVRAIREDRLEELASAEARDERQKVVQELLTGHVLAFSRTGPARISPRTIVPVEDFEVGLRQLSEAALLDALRESVERNAPDGREVRILEATLAESNLRREGDRRWLSILVRPVLNADSRRINVEIEDSRLPLAVRRTMAERIALVVDDHPELPFAEHLRKEARGDRPLALDVQDVLGALESQVAGLADVDPSLRSERHDQLLEQTAEIETWCMERIGNEVTATLVAGTEHSAAISRLIEDAERQLVLSTMSVRERTFRSMLSLLRARLNDGVQIFLLWGIDRNATLDADVLNGLTQLAYEFPHHFHFSERPSRTHAKLVVQDDARVLVTSRNPLGSGRSETYELGVELRSSDPSGPCGVIEEMLQWAQRSYPDFLTSQLMYTSAKDFGAGDESRSPNGRRAGMAMLRRPSSPASSLSPAEGDELPEALDASLGAAWAREWQRLTRRLRQLEQRARSQAARVMLDAQHREMLWRAVRTARVRLLICSDQLGPEVMDDRMLDALDTRLVDGLHVALIWRRLTKSADDRSPKPDERLAELAARHPRLRLIGPVETHAKVIVADDTSVVSSFNFLSQEGVYEHGAMGGTRRLRSEVGIQITGAAFADTLVGALARQFGELPADFPATLPPSSPKEAPESQEEDLPGPDDPTAVLLRLGEAADERSRAACLTSAFQQSKAPQLLLQDLIAAALPDELLRCAVAARLLWSPSHGDGERASALGWLAASGWRRRDFVEAAILRAAAGDDDFPGVPAPSVVTAFAALDTSHFVEAATKARSSDRGPGGACLAVAGALALGLYGDPTGADLIEAGPDLPESWAELLSGLLAYWSATYEPLPIARIKADVDVARHVIDAEQRWVDLERAIDVGEQKVFAFASGRRTRGLLYGQTGAFGRLRTIARTRDGRGLRAWLAEWNGLTVDDFLDNATREATGRGDQLFERGTRDDYVRRLEAIFATARAAGEFVQVTTGRESSGRAQAAADFAALFSGRWDDLNAAAQEQDEPLRTALEIALERLAVLKDWRL